MMNVILYSDGSARGNPNGPGGYGCLLRYEDANHVIHERRFSAGYKKTTNNRMELMGVIAGLEALTKPCNVTVISDSKYVTDAFNAHWIDGWIKKNWKTANGSPVKNIDLWKRLLEASTNHNVTYQWIKGHAGHPENELCDCLATKAADGSNLLDDCVE